MAARKNTATEKALARAVKSFNQRVDRALKAGRLTPDTAPARRSMKEIRADLQGMTPQMRGKAMKALTAELKRISDKDALQLVKTEGGVTMTKYEVAQAERLTAKAKRNIERSQRRKRKREREAATIAGQRAQPVPEWSDGIQPAKPTMSKESESARQKLRQLELLAIGGEWAKYRANLIKNLENHYTGADLKKALNFLSSLSDADLRTLFESGDEFASQDYHYEAKPAVNHAIEKAKEKLGR